LWTEVGYDFQYDIRTTDALYLKNEDGEFVRTVSGERVRDDRVDRTQINHAVRLFGGYENSLSDAVSFRTGLEYLQSVLVAGRWRLNWDIGLTAHLVQKLSLAATFSVRMDNDPLPGVRQTDTLSALSLVYTFF
jgi:putative salt-induced outer membrane protein